MLQLVKTQNHCRHRAVVMSAKVMHRLKARLRTVNQVPQATYV